MITVFDKFTDTKPEKKESDMPKKTIDIKTLRLAHSREGIISVCHIEKPYGEQSSPVVSVAVSMEGKKEDWKVHIPYENLDDLIKALNEARKVCETLPHEQPHIMNLGADTGGGQ